MSDQPSTFTALTGLGVCRNGDVKPTELLPSCDLSNIPDPPNTYSDFAKQKWMEIILLLKGRGTWSYDWIPALDQLCKNLDMMESIDEAIRRGTLDGTFGLMVPVGSSVKVNPLMVYRLNHSKLLTNQLAHFGLTPSSARACYLSDETKLPSLRGKDSEAIPEDSSQNNLSFFDDLEAA